MKTKITALAALTLCIFWQPIAGAQAFKYAWPDTDFEQVNIDLKEIMSGGPPKDGIPPVDQPQFDTVAEARDWIAPLEPVIAVSIAGTARAYPLQILTWHEIVNDQIDDTFLTVTFCPLCNASIVFDRDVDGEILDFGTTGLLRRSDLVMYDRQTESWWQQFTGSAIVGEKMGAVLTRIPSTIISFASFAQSAPDGQVLNRQTGTSRPYGQNPYPGYDDINSSPFLYRGKTDTRIAPMERVLGVTVADQYKIYPFSAMAKRTVIEDTVGGKEILVVATGKLYSALDQREIVASRQINEINAWQRRPVDSDQLLSFRSSDGFLVDNETGSKWDVFGRAVDGPLSGSQLRPVDSGIHFAFAWLAFNPQTVIFSSDDAS
jgi:hypothetical protein